MAVSLSRNSILATETLRQKPIPEFAPLGGGNGPKRGASAPQLRYHRSDRGY